MANSIFQALRGAQQPQQPPFVQFMEQMQGKDPNAIIQDLVRSGRINQTQLDQVQQRAQQIQGAMEPFRKMFGF